MNKLIVVTGGSRGIGRSIIEKFAAEGFDIVTTSRKEADLEKLAREINKKFPLIKFHYLAADLSSTNRVQLFANYVKKLNQPVEILVNNSGFYVPGQVHNEPEGILETMLNTNLYSAYHLTRELIGGMMEAKKGHIFNMCSVASITPYVNGGSYCISKFALLGFSKILREEMKSHGIRVTAVLPGATKTSSWDGVDLPKERFILSEDIAEVVWSAYKLSPSAVVEDITIRPQLGDI